MFASVRVEGKIFEIRGDKGAVYPFRVSEVSKKKVFAINLQLDEFRWLAREMVRFCYSKGEPLWVRTFRGRNHCLLLQLRKNKNGRFIVLSEFSYSGRSRTVIFPEGPKADGWFGISKLLKESLLGATNSNGVKAKEVSNAARPLSHRPVSFANIVRGAIGVENYGQLKGWRCRACGSWDIYAAILGDVQRGTAQTSRERGLNQGLSLNTNRKDAKSRISSISPRNYGGFRTRSPPCSKDLQAKRLAQTSAHLGGFASPSGNRFQALRDLLENYPDSESCSSVSAYPRDSFEPLPTLGDVQLKGSLSRNKVSNWLVYHRKNNLRKGEVALEGGNISSRGSELMVAEEVGFQPGGFAAHNSEEAPLPIGGNDHSIDRGSAWVLDHILPMCKTMGLAIEGRESELLAFFASLEATKKTRSQADVQVDVEEAGGEEDVINDG